MEAGACQNGKPPFLERRPQQSRGRRSIPLPAKLAEAALAGDIKNCKDRRQRDQQPFRLAFGKPPPLTQGRLY